MSTQISNHRSPRTAEAAGSPDCFDCAEGASRPIRIRARHDDEVEVLMRPGHFLPRALAPVMRTAHSTGNTTINNDMVFHNGEPNGDISDTLSGRVINGIGGRS